MTPSNETPGKDSVPYIDETFQQRIRPYIDTLNDNEAAEYFEEAEKRQPLQNTGRRHGLRMLLPHDVETMLRKNWTQYRQRSEQRRERMAACLTCRHHYTRYGNDHCDNQENGRDARDRCNEIIPTEFQQIAAKRSYKDIARELGISWKTVQRACHHHGIR